MDDAIEHLVQYLVAEITKPQPRIPVVPENKYDCDFWIPLFVGQFWFARDPTFANRQKLEQESYYKPFYDAAWELCRIGVLRPGETAPMGTGSHGRGFQGDGFSLTEF